MESSVDSLDRLKKDIKLAEKFDRELVDIQRRSCEPSLLGGGNRTQAVLDSLKTEANELWNDVRGVADLAKERNRLGREEVEQMASRMKQMKEMLLLSEAHSGIPSSRPERVPRVFEELYNTQKTDE